MEQINPYAVARNTATYDAYRAYVRGMMRAGQAYVLLGVMITPMTPIVMAVGRRYLHRSPTDWTWVLASLLGLTALGCGSMVFGSLRMARYRREHPIPEAWRQVPPVNWPPGSGQRPRLRRRG